jgi:hypothetical protein
MGVTTRAVQDAFFEILEPPRITSSGVLRKAIARGVSEGVFGYTTGMPQIGPDGKYQVNPAKVALERQVSEDEVDLDSGFLILPEAIPTPAPSKCPKCGKSPCECEKPALCPKCGKSPCECSAPPTLCPKCGKSPCVCKTGKNAIRLCFTASRDQVFKVFPAIANLADKSDGGHVSIVIEGSAEDGYDPSWLRNAVEEPLDEANIEGLKIE